MSHTPGPWEIAPYNGIEIKFIVDKEDNLVADCWPYIDPYYRTANDRRYKNRKEPNEADARLIAAAPDLLKTLNEIADWCDRWTTPGHPVSAIAHAAIKKAMGEE
jgi:hypothetical protein